MDHRHIYKRLYKRDAVRHGGGEMRTSMMFAQPLYLAGCAVGHAGALVVGQVEVGGTGALVAPAGGEKAKVAAAAVVGLTRVVEHWGGTRGEAKGFHL